MNIVTTMDNTRICEEQAEKMLEQEWNNYNQAWNGKSYNSVIRQLQFIMNNDVFMNKQLQEMMKRSEMMNNTNTHAYMQAAVNVMFAQIHAN